MKKFLDSFSRTIVYSLSIGISILVWYYVIKVSWPYLKAGFRFAMMKIDGMNNYEFLVTWLAILLLVLWLEARSRLKKRERRVVEGRLIWK